MAKNKTKKYKAEALLNKKFNKDFKNGPHKNFFLIQINNSKTKHIIHQRVSDVYFLH